MLMQKISLSLIVVFMLAFTIFSCLFPYPILSDYTNLTSQNAFEINTYHETELFPNMTDSKKVLDLTWEEIDVLLPFEEPFEVIFPNEEHSFFVVRTGGKNHADIEPSTPADLAVMTENFESSDLWQLFPVIVKLNDSAFLPACLSSYSHGYKSNNFGHGHFCLHFKNSKTHSTKLVDKKFQDCVKASYDLAKQYLKNEF